jgi:hypothetical protein
MEHTVKNLHNIIEMLESRKTLQADGGNFHSIPKKDENSCLTRENDDLILGIRKKSHQIHYWESRKSAEQTAKS